MYSIEKSFPFCYGHRVWTQELDQELSLNAACKCRHLHGHEAKVDIGLEATHVARDGMITDFNNLGWFKKWLDDVVDHKFIMDEKDPLIHKMGFHLMDVANMVKHADNFKTFPPSSARTLEQEYLESFVFVPFVPTSENMAKWLFDLVWGKMHTTAHVSFVRFHETEKSFAQYSDPLIKYL